MSCSREPEEDDPLLEARAASGLADEEGIEPGGICDGPAVGGIAIPGGGLWEGSICGGKLAILILFLQNGGGCLFLSSRGTPQTTVSDRVEPV